LGSHFFQAEFARDGIVHDSIDRNSRMNSFQEGGTDVGEQGNMEQYLH